MTENILLKEMCVQFIVLLFLIVVWILKEGCQIHLGLYNCDLTDC